MSERPCRLGGAAAARRSGHPRRVRAASVFCAAVVGGVSLTAAVAIAPDVWQGQGHDTVFTSAGHPGAETVSEPVERQFREPVARATRPATVSPEPSPSVPPEELEPSEELEDARTPEVDGVVFTVGVDGDAQEVHTIADRVDIALKGAGIAVGSYDRIEPAADAAPVDGATVTVTRAEVSVITQVRTLPYRTEERPADGLPRGEVREVRTGQEGTVEVTEEVARIGDEEVGRRTLAEEVVAAPVARVVEVGRGAPTPTPTAEPTRLPEPDPEPTEEPTPEPTPTPEPEPTPEPTPEPEPEPAPDGNTESGVASWYDHPSGPGYTAAHKTIPFGTEVKVTNVDNGEQVTVTINDRGPFVGGRIIDLSREAFATIAEVSGGVANVRIQW